MKEEEEEGEGKKNMEFFVAYSIRHTQLNGMSLGVYFLLFFNADYKIVNISNLWRSVNLRDYGDALRCESNVRFPLTGNANYSRSRVIADDKVQK